MPQFGQIMTAMITPFDEAGAVDYDVAQQLAAHLVAEGNDGLVVCGTTGESPTLSDEEKLGMFAAVVEAVDVPVIAGSVGYNTAHSIELNVAVEVPEWGGQKVRIMLEEDAWFDGKETRFLDGRQTAFFLIR